MKDTGCRGRTPRWESWSRCCVRLQLCPSPVVPTWAGSFTQVSPLSVVAGNWAQAGNSIRSLPPEWQAPRDLSYHLLPPQVWVCISRQLGVRSQKLDHGV